MVLGPPRSGKTSAVMIPALMACPGAAVSTSTRPVEQVLRWTLRQELTQASEILEDADTPIAADVLAGIKRTDERERSSIFSATAGVLAAYNSDSVRASAARPNFDPDQFTRSQDTVYITAPEHKQALCAPLIVGLLEQLRHAVYHHSRQDPSDTSPMLWLLDEVANIAPIHDLPALVSQAGGQGLQVMVGLQDLSQARTRWGSEAAEGFLSLFQSKLILTGIADAKTLEALSLTLGEYDRHTASQTLGRTNPEHWRAQPTHSDSVSYQTQRQRVLTPGEIARLPAGRALLVEGADWQLLGLTKWYEHEPWRRIADSASL